MKRHRLLEFVIILCALLIAEGVVLYAAGSSRATSQKSYFADEILICVPASVTEQRLNVIVASANGVLLGLDGLPCGVPNAGTWTVEVPWAKSQGDTNRVLVALRSHPEIIWADLNAIESNL